MLLMARGTGRRKLLAELRTSEKILLGLFMAGAVVTDLLDDILSDRSSVYGLARGLSYENLNYFRERRKKKLYAAFSRLLAKKLVEVERRAQERSFRLTEHGLEVLFSRFPKLKYGQRSWDGFWRLVVYDIAESEKLLRNRLRKELRHFGFKFVQKSVWLCPFAVEEELEKILKKEKLWGKLLIFKARLSGEETDRLVGRFWGNRVTLGRRPTNLAEKVEQTLADPFLPRGLREV